MNKRVIFHHTYKTVIRHNYNFYKGLNIICGASDSGKTCVLKCIQFAMGVIEKLFKKQTGYDSVSLDIIASEGTIHLSRRV